MPRRLRHRFPRRPGASPEIVSLHRRNAGRCARRYHAGTSRSFRSCARPRRLRSRASALAVNQLTLDVEPENVHEILVICHDTNGLMSTAVLELADDKLL